MESGLFLSTTVFCLPPTSTLETGPGDFSLLLSSLELLQLSRRHKEVVLFYHGLQLTSYHLIGDIRRWFFPLISSVHLRLPWRVAFFFQLPSPVYLLLSITLEIQGGSFFLRLFPPVDHLPSDRRDHPVVFSTTAISPLPAITTKGGFFYYCLQPTSCPPPTITLETQGSGFV